jgi:hypothetical protein
MVLIEIKLADGGTALVNPNRIAWLRQFEEHIEVSFGGAGRFTVNMTVADFLEYLRSAEPRLEMEV